MVLLAVVPGMSLLRPRLMQALYNAYVTVVDQRTDNHVLIDCITRVDTMHVCCMCSRRHRAIHTSRCCRQAAGLDQDDTETARGLS